jgi:hypothetical protein
MDFPSQNLRNSQKYVILRNSKDFESTRRSKNTLPFKNGMSPQNLVLVLRKSHPVGFHMQKKAKLKNLYFISQFKTFLQGKSHRLSQKVAQKGKLHQVPCVQFQKDVD